MSQLPTLLAGPQSLAIAPSPHETALLVEAHKLFVSGFHPHALLNLWNAAVANLRRRVEAYGTDLWASVVKDEGGRKKYNKTGDTLADRWWEVDDLVLIKGADQLGLINKKGAKTLEMINWTRNHASPAHDSDTQVEPDDVIAMALMLQSNLFTLPMPDPGHSIAGLFEPVKNAVLDQQQIDMLSDQIKAAKQSDVRNAFGFLLDMLAAGVSPAATNAVTLLPVAWDRASEDLRKTAGLRYHAVRFDKAVDTSADKAMDTRLLDFLTAVNGIKYIPEATRAQLYRHAARLMAQAKDKSYGWAAEYTAAQQLAQFGPNVPAIAFEEVYQEIVSVLCGNYWGNSGSATILEPFIMSLNTDEVLQLIRIIQFNDRAKAELFQDKPKARAILLLEELKEKLTVVTHKAEADAAMAVVKAM
jgi:hypothetical protein